MEWIQKQLRKLVVIDHIISNQQSEPLSIPPTDPHNPTSSTYPPFDEDEFRLGLRLLSSGVVGGTSTLFRICELEFSHRGTILNVSSRTNTTTTTTTVEGDGGYAREKDSELETMEEKESVYESEDGEYDVEEGAEDMVADEEMIVEKGNRNHQQWQETPYFQTYDPNKWPSVSNHLSESAFGQVGRTTPQNEENEEFYLDVISDDDGLGSEDASISGFALWRLAPPPPYTNIGPEKRVVVRYPDFPISGSSNVSYDNICYEEEDGYEDIGYPSASSFENRNNTNPHESKPVGKTSRGRSIWMLQRRRKTQRKNWTRTKDNWVIYLKGRLCEVYSNWKTRVKEKSGSEVNLLNDYDIGSVRSVVSDADSWSRKSSLKSFFVREGVQEGSSSDGLGKKCEMEEGENLIGEDEGNEESLEEEVKQEVEEVAKKENEDDFVVIHSDYEEMIQLESDVSGAILYIIGQYAQGDGEASTAQKHEENHSLEDNREELEEFASVEESLQEGALDASEEKVHEPKAGMTMVTNQCEVNCEEEEVTDVEDDTNSSISLGSIYSFPYEIITYT
ncbi:uncharacterized protein J8A68_000694 [[Candida] subhashii]|uniref:Uncharacterized protein n=1 Tax=[Candida] subhashii TaxID=561895 RepID=A0A8J5UUG2_9ASCO|nr:uncharacterized protein J8A68_000694 [[Candida] subhashii]KAG7665867.1 hypothetical protein J8A68_000694 [[Candida] subhashii]